MWLPSANEGVRRPPCVKCIPNASAQASAVGPCSAAEADTNCIFRQRRLHSATKPPCLVSRPGCPPALRPRLQGPAKTHV